MVTQSANEVMTQPLFVPYVYMRNTARCTCFMFISVTFFITVWSYLIAFISPWKNSSSSGGNVSLVPIFGGGSDVAQHIRQKIQRRTCKWLAEHKQMISHDPSARHGTARHGSPPARHPPSSSLIQHDVLVGADMPTTARHVTARHGAASDVHWFEPHHVV